MQDIVGQGTTGKYRGRLGLSPCDFPPHICLDLPLTAFSGGLSSSSSSSSSESLSEPSTSLPGCARVGWGQVGVEGRAVEGERLKRKLG